MLMHFPQKHIDVNDIPKLNFQGKTLNFVSDFKFLGVLIDDTLSWNKHVHYISNKLSRICGVLSSLKKYLPLRILKTIYNALILPHLYYGICAWGFNSCQRLKTIQKRAVRHVCNKKYNAHTKPLCHDLQILLLDDIHNFVCIKLIYKIQHKSVPEYFTTFPCFYAQAVRQQRTILRPSHLADYNIQTLPCLRPLINCPTTNKKLSEKCLRYKIYDIVNSNVFPPLVVNKIETHSFNGFSNYTKNFILSNYNVNCTEVNCFICSN